MTLQIKNELEEPSMELKLIPAYEHHQEIVTLFTEYTDMLLRIDQTFSRYLDIQNYDQELQHPEEKYALPNGRLYLAYWDDQLAGCIALRQLDETRCELKRLYVRPQFRGHRIGEALVRRLIDDARQIGYRHMLLDSLPPLRTAVSLYREVGFYDIPCYNDSPGNTTIFLQYDL